MPYLKVTKTTLLRRTPLGLYLCVPSRYQLEAFLPIIEIDETIEELLTFCDGTHTREDILHHLSQISGEPVEEIAGDLDEFIQYMVDEGVLEWVETPSFVEPFFKGNKPLSITLDITFECNLQCPMCSSDSGTLLEDKLTVDDFVSLVSQIKKLKPTPVILSGGEPLLKKDILLHIIRELSPVTEIELTFFTNGTFITKDYARELRDAGLQVACVSIDGHTEKINDAIRGKGTFKKIIQGIENLKEVGIHVKAVAVISRLNYPYLREIRDFIRQISDSFLIIPIVPFGRARGSDLILGPEEEFYAKTAASESEKIQIGVCPRIRCDVGETLYITANGDIYPCFYMKYPEFKVGNIRETDLSQIYNSDALHNLLKLTIDDIEECRDCDIRYYCAGACRGMSFLKRGSVYYPDLHNCEANKMVVKKILEDGEENTRNIMQTLVDAARRSG